MLVRKNPPVVKKHESAPCSKKKHGGGRGRKVRKRILSYRGTIWADFCRDHIRGGGVRESRGGSKGSKKKNFQPFAGPGDKKDTVDPESVRALLLTFGGEKDEETAPGGVREGPWSWGYVRRDRRSQNGLHYY